MNPRRGDAGDALGVIVAGGRGTRLGLDRPKALAPIGDTPLLGHQLAMLAAAGLRRVVVLGGFGAEHLAAALPGLTPPGLTVDLVVEPRPMGTAGCIRWAGLPPVPLVVVYGDILCAVDVAALLGAHRASGAHATIVVHPNDHPADSDLVELEPSGRVRAIHGKPHPPGLRVANLVSAGMYVLGPALVQAIPTVGAPDLVHDVLARRVDGCRRADHGVHGYRTTEYLRDVGTPERWLHSDDDWRRGLVAGAHRSRRRPTAFLDRDGTLNRPCGYVTRPEQIELLPGAAEAVRRLNRAGALAVVVTNQPVVARGEVSEPQLARIHAALETALGAEGAYLDAIYHCPHHPHAGHPGEVAALKVRCRCRKPAPGLIEAAVRDLPVDPARAVLFGDAATDVQAATNAGIPGVRVGDGADLLAAVDTWLATVAGLTPAG